MADEADMAQAQNEIAMHYHLKQRKPAGPAPTGLCLHCNLVVLPPRRWCDAECRDDWELEQASRKGKYAI
jgi:uncharacterized OB-fold protein